MYRSSVWQILWGALLVAHVAAASEGGGDSLSSQPELAHDTATFSMYCYWTGEATLGRVDGVLASRIGHWAGREIVQVDFDPDRTSLEELARALRANRSLYAVHPGPSQVSAAAADSEVVPLRGQPHFIEAKHSLRTVHPELAALDLTEQQAIALNAWAYFGGPMPDVLSPEQLARLARLDSP